MQTDFHHFHIALMKSEQLWNLPIETSSHLSQNRSNVGRFLLLYWGWRWFMKLNVLIGFCLNTLPLKRL